MELAPLKRTPDPGPNSKFRPHNLTKAQAYRTRRFIVKSVMSTSTQKSSLNRYSLQFQCKRMYSCQHVSLVAFGMIITYAVTTKLNACSDE